MMWEVLARSGLLGFGSTIGADKYDKTVTQWSLDVKSWDNLCEFSSFMSNNEQELSKGAHSSIEEKLYQEDINLFSWLVDLAEKEKTGHLGKDINYLALAIDWCTARFRASEDNSPFSEDHFHW